MAGGKQSPRDKMIGMMYLVLTALLALQVSNSVLEKFIFINEAFVDTNTGKIAENVEKVSNIQGAVSESGSRPQDVAVLEKAKKVREATAKIYEEIEGYKTQLIEMTGGRDENGNMLGVKDIDSAPTLFVNEGKGDVLKGTINGYSAFLREITGDETIKDIAKDAIEIEAFKYDENQNKKGFAELNFGHNTPMVGALASLSQFQSDILAEETKALEELARSVGADKLKFDQIVPMVRPESKIVAAGSEYIADMFIAASSSSVSPTMTWDGNEMEVVDGMGKVKFVARAGNYDANGLSKQSFIGAIKVKLPGGRDTTFVDTIEYTVSKPVIQIQSASVQALYLNCGNELTVNVPALGTSYNPVFNAKGGSTIKGADRGDVTIVPTSAKVTLSVSSGGNLIGTEEFKVKRIPKPEILIYSGGKQVDEKRGTKGCPRSIKIQAEADESFAQFLPKDALFRVAESEVTLVRSGRAVQSVRPKGPDVNLSQLAGEARPGDVLVIEVKKVQRRNFKGAIEDVASFGSPIKQIRIN
ncbi:gliding motility protein GldM [Reichenbachiella agarivorans]|uniref:Gliding motility protein GldM n=1 Tax=Reichenbachiella agarivorans TaxID=2979464 RepID=A0ABY6CWD0_9BACT|nr:gliding motility protein GldM [Reichenbachiella agarivorans]UXP33758.1 gliding motility protein GldM [Reichenbachiella agarivorans]